MDLKGKAWKPGKPAWDALGFWEGAWETQKEGRPRATSCSVSIFFNKTHGSSDSRFSHDSEKRKKARCRVQNGRQPQGQSGCAPTHPCTHVVSFEWHTVQPAACPGIPGWGWADGRLDLARRTRKKKEKPFNLRPVRPGATEGQHSTPSTPGDSMTWEKLNLWAADQAFRAFPAQRNRPNSIPTAPDPDSSHSSQSSHSRSRGSALAGPWP